MANLKIGILSSSQRLTEVSKKFRAKMCGYLVGHILPEDFIGIIQRALRLHMGSEAKKVTASEFRYSFYYTGLNQTFKVSRFQQVGKPYEIPRTQPNPEPQNERIIRTKQIKKKRSIFQKIKYVLDWFVNFPVDPDFIEYCKTQRRTQSTTSKQLKDFDPENTENNHASESEESDAVLLASNDDELDESLFM